MFDPSTESTVIVEKGLKLQEEPEDGGKEIYSRHYYWRYSSALK